MQNFYRLALALACAGSLIGSPALAGNDTKRGQAGATELLINPWARSTGWNSCNTGSIRGVESMMLNMGGLAYLKNTEVILAVQRYLSGSGIQINSLGFGQRLSPTGVLGISLMQMSLGNFYETTVNQPDGTGNTFKPQYFNLGVGYSKTFSRTITAGILLRSIYQSISNASAFGVAFDAGIQYQTGARNQFKFGVSLKNVGPKMVYGGEGLSFRGNRDAIGITLNNRTAPFEMPTLLNLGASYDLAPAEQVRLTPAFSFVSNSYTKDQYIPGLEFAFREQFMVRGSYQFVQDFVKKEYTRTDIYTGLAVGATIQVPLAGILGNASSEEGDAGELAGETPPERAKRDIRLGLDYSYRTTNPYSGTHAIGLILTL